MGRSRVGVIVVDLQGDFTLWKRGSLAVPGTDAAFVAKVSEATLVLKRAGFGIYATQDWHPADHISFATKHPGKKAFETIEVDGRTQTLWPPHCVQNTEGAELVLDESMFQAIVRKGQNPLFDSYSGFQDDGGEKTELDAILRAARIERLIIYGLATDYCVRATAVDAALSGYEVVVVEGLSKGVAPETTARALEEMRTKGIVTIKEMDLTVIVDR